MVCINNMMIKWGGLCVCDCYLFCKKKEIDNNENVSSDILSYKLKIEKNNTKSNFDYFINIDCRKN